MKRFFVLVFVLVILLGASAGATDKCEYEAVEKHAVTVDYSQTMEEMIGAGRYDWISAKINSKNFPIPSSKRGKEEVTIELVNFKKCMKLKDFLSKLDKAGLRPATLSELLALGAQHPEKQREFAIVALGSVWQDRDGIHHVAYLVHNHASRLLHLQDVDLAVEYSDSYIFAAVRK